jgi:hypothetical protein
VEEGPWRPLRLHVDLVPTCPYHPYPCHPACRLRVEGFDSSHGDPDPRQATAYEEGSAKAPCLLHVVSGASYSCSDCDGSSRHALHGASVFANGEKKLGNESGVCVWEGSSRASAQKSRIRRSRRMSLNPSPNLKSPSHYQSRCRKRTRLPAWRDAAP